MRNSRVLTLAALCLVTVSGFAGPEPKNLRVLPKTIPADQLKTTMEGFTRQLGVKCAFCHVPDQFEKDDRPHKSDARRMIALVLDLKARKTVYFGPHVKEGVITCALCHRGKAEPEPFVSSLLPVISFLAPPADKGPPPRNLQVLPKSTTSDEVKRAMNDFTGQLGVKCDFCHGQQQEKDDKPHKADARRMMKLVLEMKAKKATYFGPRVKEAVITCGLCHRGKAEPELLGS